MTDDDGYGGAQILGRDELEESSNRVHVFAEEALRLRVLYLDGNLRRDGSSGRMGGGRCAERMGPSDDS